MGARNPSRDERIVKLHASAKREAAALFGSHSAARGEYIAARLAGRSRAMAAELACAMIED
jgi:hypothetical protein